MNKLVVALCASAAVLLVEAYDFQDADFNQLLSSNFEEIKDSLDELPLHPRAKRDEDAVTVSSTSDEKCRKKGAHRGRPRLCCAEQTIDNLHDVEKELSKACFKDVTGMDKLDKHEHGHHKKFDLFSCEGVERRKTDMICIQQCIGQKKGILSEDGTPQPEKLVSYLKENYAKESWLEAVIDKIVTNCLADAKNATANPIKYYTENLKMCNPSALSLKHCLFKEIQLRCPAEQIKDRSACDRFQDRLRKGEGRELEAPLPPAPLEGTKDE